MKPSSRSFTLGSAAAATAIASILLLEPAAAWPPYQTAWLARYPTSTLASRMQSLTGSACFTCHTPPSYSEEGSCYRLDLRDRINNFGMSFEQAMADIEWRDSDGDGVPNIVEILMPRAGDPTKIGYHPGLVGPTGLPPCSSTPTTPVTNQNETPAWCYANCDSSTTPPALNVLDFSCFLNQFAAGNAYANCDGSTTPPALNVLDFSCFLNQFAAGCP